MVFTYLFNNFLGSSSGKDKGFATGNVAVINNSGGSTGGYLNSNQASVLAGSGSTSSSISGNYHSPLTSATGGCSAGSCDSAVKSSNVIQGLYVILMNLLYS